MLSKLNLNFGILKRKVTTLSFVLIALPVVGFSKNVELTSYKGAFNLQRAIPANAPCERAISFFVEAARPNVLNLVIYGKGALPSRRMDTLIVGKTDKQKINGTKVTTKTSLTLGDDGGVETVQKQVYKKNGMFSKNTLSQQYQVWAPKTLGDGRIVMQTRSVDYETQTGIADEITCSYVQYSSI